METVVKRNVTLRDFWTQIFVHFSKQMWRETTNRSLHTVLYATSTTSGTFISVTGVPSKVEACVWSKCSLLNRFLLHLLASLLPTIFLHQFYQRLTSPPPFGYALMTLLSSIRLTCTSNWFVLQCFHSFSPFICFEIFSRVYFKYVN
jgi:hypothetical protein